MQYFPTPTETKSLSTKQLRESFLLTDLFQSGKLTFHFTDLDRAAVGGAVPLTDSIQLDNPPALRAEFFAQRREIGVLNIGGDGTVTVDGKTLTSSATAEHTVSGATLKLNP